MTAIAKHIPNLFTLANLLCGCLGIMAVFNYPTYEPAYFVWVACVFDFFDGFAARALKTSSPIGKELDSLADMVSFGVLPSITMYTWMNKIAPQNLLAYSAFLLAIFSALRLAKFNVDENQRDSFIGLPTPANALFITGLAFLGPPFDLISASLGGLIAITLLFSLLLVAPLSLFALKFKNFTWADNKLRFTFAGLAVLLLSWKQAEGISLVILLYLLLSLAEGMLSKK